MTARSRLAARIEELGLPVSKVAVRAGVVPKTVTRWIEGRTNPRRYQRNRIADVLDVPLASTPDEHGVDWYLVRDDEIDGHPAPRGHDGAVNRRTFLAGFGGSLAASVVQLEHAAASADTGGQREAALRLLGHTHHAAGASAFDRLDLTAADDHFHQAHGIGVEVGDPEMIANAQIQLGDVARRQGRYETALRLLSGAERHTDIAGVLIQVRRWQTLARAYAEMGERAPFDRAIGQAEELAHGVSPEHHREGDLSPRGMRLERGQGLTLLGEPAAALAIYEQSAPPSFRSDRERGSFLIIHAQALAHAGRLDQGVRVAIDGLRLARSYQSQRHVSRVQRMYDRLTRSWTPSEPHLVALRDALAA